MEGGKVGSAHPTTVNVKGEEAREGGKVGSAHPTVREGRDLVDAFS